MLESTSGKGWWGERPSILLDHRDSFGFDFGPGSVDFHQLLPELFEDGVRRADLGLHQLFTQHGVKAAKIAHNVGSGFGAQSGLKVANDGYGMANLLCAEVRPMVLERLIGASNVLHDLLVQHDGEAHGICTAHSSFLIRALGADRIHPISRRYSSIRAMRSLTAGLWTGVEKETPQAAH